MHVVTATIFSFWRWAMSSASRQEDDDNSMVDDAIRHREFRRVRQRIFFSIWQARVLISTVVYVAPIVWNYVLVCCVVAL